MTGPDADPDPDDVAVRRSRRGHLALAAIALGALVGVAALGPTVAEQVGEGLRQETATARPSPIVPDDGDPDAGAPSTSAADDAAPTTQRAGTTPPTTVEAPPPPPPPPSSSSIVATQILGIRADPLLERVEFMAWSDGGTVATRHLDGVDGPTLQVGLRVQRRVVVTAGPASTLGATLELASTAGSIEVAVDEPAWITAVRAVPSESGFVAEELSYVARPGDAETPSDPPSNSGSSRLPKRSGWSRAPTRPTGRVDGVGRPLRRHGTAAHAASARRLDHVP